MVGRFFLLAVKNGGDLVDQLRRTAHYLIRTIPTANSNYDLYYFEIIPQIEGHGSGTAQEMDSGTDGTGEAYEMGNLDPERSERQDGTPRDAGGDNSEQTGRAQNDNSTDDVGERGELGPSMNTGESGHSGAPEQSSVQGVGGTAEYIPDVNSEEGSSQPQLGDGLDHSLSGGTNNNESGGNSSDAVSHSEDRANNEHHTSVEGEVGQAAQNQDQDRQPQDLAASSVHTAEVVASRLKFRGETYPENLDRETFELIEGSLKTGEAHFIALGGGFTGWSDKVASQLVQKVPFLAIMGMVHLILDKVEDKVEEPFSHALTGLKGGEQNSARTLVGGIAIASINSALLNFSFHEVCRYMKLPKKPEMDDSAQSGTSKRVTLPVSIVVFVIVTVVSSALNQAGESCKKFYTRDEEGKDVNKAGKILLYVLLASVLAVLEILIRWGLRLFKMENATTVTALKVAAGSGPFVFATFFGSKRDSKTIDSIMSESIEQSYYLLITTKFVLPILELVLLFLWEQKQKKFPTYWRIRLGLILPVHYRIDAESEILCVISQFLTHGLSTEHGRNFYYVLFYSLTSSISCATFCNFYPKDMTRKQTTRASQHHIIASEHPYLRYMRLSHI